MGVAYDYLFLNLDAGRTAHRAVADQLQSKGPEIAAAGGEILGQFSPQLGWNSHEAAILLRWGDGTSGRDQVLAGLTGAAPVLETRRTQFTPTIRPSDTARIKPGGIHVHRWFTVASHSVEEFVDLSGRAWPDFERRFDTSIFGLFAAAPDEDAAVDEVSLLLITRYADHGVWEASRDPSTEAMQLFARRQALTRRTQACSTLLVA